MKKIIVLYENPDWMPPLERELKLAGLHYDTWHIQDTTFDLSSVPPDAIYLNRMSPSSHTRGHRESVDATRELIFWIESFGKTVVNGSKAFSFETSKINQYTSLQKFGLQTPRTIAVTGSPKTLAEAAKAMPTPFITKHNRGGKGLGVQLFTDHEAFRNFVFSPNFEKPADHMLLIQEFIRPKNPNISRVEIVNGEFVYAIDVSTELGFELCPAEACDVGDRFCPTTETADEPTADRQSFFSLKQNFDDPIISKYIDFMKSHGIDIAGIEFIEDVNGNKITYDINCTTNYSPAVENKHGFNGMAKISSYLRKLASEE